MGLNPSFLRRTRVRAGPAQGRRAATAMAAARCSSCLFQRGAADALNVVVPHGERGVLHDASDDRRFRGRSSGAAKHGDRSRRILRTASVARAVQASCGTTASSRRCTRSEVRATRARTSTRRTTWRAARRTTRARATAGSIATSRRRRNVRRVHSWHDAATARQQGVAVPGGRDDAADAAHSRGTGARRSR